uniref:F-box only protein 9 n=1 Tax=Anoplophora glabripennis TaxID=217634 RepID=V5IA03_ANOGL
MEGKIEKTGGGNGPNLTSGESSDGEEQDEPSSTNQEQAIEDTLANFREKWQKEIRDSPNHQIKPKTRISKETDQVDDGEHNARILFLKGIEMEKSGKFYEAIQFYRRAVQIVPDIEFKLERMSKPKLKDRQATEDKEKGDIFTETIEEKHESSDENSEDEEILEGELLPRIQKKLAKGYPLCVPKFEQKTTHISELPVEIIFYILRWLVSADLDLKGLEVFSAVCRGFYLCARDPEIWRLACLRVWGLNCGPSPDTYQSWREMYIERPRVHFNGCYISKTTYIRPGENSFQDQFYRPWHLIAYYRYLRFFPEGVVLMLTTADEPAQCVGLMKSRNSRSPVLSGYYRLKNDKVVIVVQKQDAKTVAQVTQGYKRHSRKKDAQENAEQTFHLELQIKGHRKKMHVQLVWTHYSVFTKYKRGDESTCNFDLIANRFPPLWFSRVKSFTAESDAPLT